MLNQDICNFHNAHAVYASYGGIVFAEEEGKNIANALGTTNKVSFYFTLIFDFRREEGRGEGEKGSRGLGVERLTNAGRV
jgi:hypothetical protein